MPRLDVSWYNINQYIKSIYWMSMTVINSLVTHMYIKPQKLVYNNWLLFLMVKINITSLCNVASLLSSVNNNSCYSEWAVPNGICWPEFKLRSLFNFNYHGCLLRKAYIALGNQINGRYSVILYALQLCSSHTHTHTQKNTL